MIETHTTWEETSHDCQVCGGIILHRTDYENGKKVRDCLQCRDCGTQWSLQGRILRRGWRRARRRPEPAPQPQSIKLPRWAPYVAGGFVILLVLTYTGLIGLIARFFLPLLVLITLGAFIYLLGRHYGWWERWGGGSS
jgi:hypothetical protein